MSMSIHTGVMAYRHVIEFLFPGTYDLTPKKEIKKIVSKEVMEPVEVLIAKHILIQDERKLQQLKRDASQLKDRILRLHVSQQHLRQYLQTI